MQGKEEILQILRKKFPQIAERSLQEDIADVGVLMHFDAGQVIMEYNSYVKMVPLIIEGAIKVTREDEREGKEMILYFLQPGETCSMSFTCCMMDKRSAIKTEAIEDTTIIGIPIQYVDAWMTKYQSWKNFVMRTYDEKMVELVRVLDSIAFEGLDQRLVKYLKARTGSSGMSFLEITHQEIANDLGASREAISRLLKKLEQQDVLTLGRNKITFQDY